MSSKAFPDSMKNRDEIFDKLFFTGYRKTRNLPALRQAWNKRISMEVALGKISHAISSGKKSGMQGRIANASEDEFDEQGAAVLDRLRWRCELDCFDLGDQANATRNMMTLIRTTVDPVRREQGIRTLRDKLVQSMKSLMDSPEEESMADGSSSSSAPRPAMRSSKRRLPPPRLRPAVKWMIPEPSERMCRSLPSRPQPGVTIFLKTSDFLQTKDVARTAVSLFMECAEHP